MARRSSQSLISASETWPMRPPPWSPTTTHLARSDALPRQRRSLVIVGEVPDRRLLASCASRKTHPSRGERRIDDETGARSRSCSSRSRSRRGEVHGHLGRRPPRRAAATCSRAACRRSSRSRAPKIVLNDAGHEVWEFEGERHFQVGQNAVAGRRPETVKIEPFRFDQMRPGCCDPHARVARHGHQRDLGVAELPVDDHRLLRPRVLPGQGSGARLRRHPRVERLDVRGVVAAASRAHHPDGHHLAGRPRDRRRRDPPQRRRGFIAVTLPERPHRIGFPSIFDEYWDPVIRACAETDTVICLHVGSSGHGRLPAREPAGSSSAPRSSASCRSPCARSGCGRAWPVRHPDLKIAMSEGGIGWVAMLLDRLDNIVDRSGYGRRLRRRRPADVLRATSSSARSTTRSGTSGSSPATTKSSPSTTTRRRGRTATPCPARSTRCRCRSRARTSPTHRGAPRRAALQRPAPVVRPAQAHRAPRAAHAADHPEAAEGERGVPLAVRRRHDRRSSSTGASARSCTTTRSPSP